MVTGNCVVEGCEKDGPYTRGMCRMHYTRVIRYCSAEGRTETIDGRPRCKPGMTLAERIAHIGYTVTANGCHEWKGHRHDAGYPMINWKRQRTYIHRAVLEMKLGRKLGAGMFACHTCDNPPCLNPAHLFEGTQRDNHADMMQKGRHRAGRGGRKTPKYPQEAFSTAYAMRAAGASVTDIAAATGMSKSYIYALHNGWSDTPKLYRKAA